MQTKYYVIKNGLYLCFDQKYRDKFFFAVPFHKEQDAVEFLNRLNGDYIVPLGENEYIERMRQELNPFNRFVMETYGSYITRRN